MSSKEIDRKIAVIFATDVVGYSKLMENDEDQTIKTIRACKEILETLFKEHGGRTFNTAGDSILAEFSSAVSAVVCASEFQNLIKERNDVNNFKMNFRIGINMGDVVKEGQDLYGDGVNVAARLESLAQPNGITLSKSVYDLVNKKTQFLFNDLGEQKVKENQFHAFDVVLDPSHKRTIKSNSSKRILIYAAIGVTLTLFIGVITYSELYSEKIERVEEIVLATDSLPVILVKPFKNLGTEDTSVSNALTESLITSLSQYRGISVLSSSTSFYVLEKKIDDNQLKENFNVNYSIQGSIQSFGKTNRLTLELNDYSKNKIIWSDKVDFKLDDIFKVQDEIGTKILGELQVNVVVGQQAKRWMEEFDKYEKYTLFLNWRREWRKFTQDGYNKSLVIIDELKNLNTSQNVIDHAEGWQIHQKLVMGLSQNIEKDTKELDEITMRLINNKGDNDAYAQRAMNEVQFLSKDCNIAKDHIKKALDLGRSVDVFTIAGSIYQSCGDFEKSAEYHLEALRLMPNDNGYFVTRSLVHSLYKIGRKNEIISLMDDKIDNDDINGQNSGMLWVYAAIEMENGNRERAKELFLRGKNNGWKAIYWKNWNKEFHDLIVPILKPLGSLN